MTATVTQAKFVWCPVLKHVFIGHKQCVPNVMLVSQNARFFKKHIVISSERWIGQTYGGKMRVGCGATRGRRNKPGSVEKKNEELYWQLDMVFRLR